ncbi:DUF4838 domain-containing protein [Verrucomicrobiota bacterium]
MNNKKRSSITYITFAVGMLTLMSSCSFQGNKTFIVKDSQPGAEIVIAENPPRMVKLAALELQIYVEKISGAKLPIVITPGTNVACHIYVGRSIYTDRMNITDEGLKYGAFRMVSGNPPQADSQAGWLVLLGHDSDFTPPEPHAKSRGDIPKMMEKWDTLTGAKWGNPVGSRMIRYHNFAMGIWEADQNGSLNAVNEFLRSLGVRWYMPGDLGEIVPKKKTIALPRIDKCVRPDFPMRVIYFAFYHGACKEDILWCLRIGLNHGREVIGNGQVGHGMSSVHARAEMKKAHPEYYALWGGRRETEKKGSGEPCLSSEGLLKENVKFARAVFDVYDEPMVSIMPQDGYASVCQCDLCKGKDTPERGWYGRMSDYVFAHNDRVAREVLKTHPDKLLSCGAYGTYLLPPEKIDNFSSNLAVGIVYHRAGLGDPAVYTQYVGIVKGWQKKITSGKIMRWVHYLHSTTRSAFHGLPVFYPHAIAKDLKFLKGSSLGDFIEVSLAGDGGLHAPGFNNLHVYLTARLYWDADQDVDKLLDEYYTLFYGPAAEEMKAFVDYSEANWQRMREDVKPIGKALDLLKAARKAAGPKDSVYSKRIALLADYLAPMKNLHNQLTKGRENVPEARSLAATGTDLKKLDGLLDDPLWKHKSVYSLSEVQTGRAPNIRATFQVTAADNALYFGIHCMEPNMKNLNIATTNNGDTNIWNGDCVELLLETQCHSYYQIVINPAGAVLDLDRKGGLNTQWSSDAEVAVHRGDNFWNAEVRIPLTGDMKGSPDPLNGVAGGMPTDTHPFFFNVCRQRIRDSGKEGYAFSPTGKETFHDPMKFGKLYIGKKYRPKK